MTTLFTIDYEAGSNGAAIDAASGWDSRGGTGIYATASAYEGLLGVEISATATYRKTITAINKWRVRWYHQANIAAPGINVNIAVARLTAANKAAVRIESAGTYRLVNVSTATGSSSAAITADSWDRLEWAVDGDAGTQTLEIYRGANRNGTTPDETLSGTFTNSTVDDIGVAWFNSVTSLVCRQDAVLCTDTPATQIGPTAVFVTVNAEVATGTGTAPFDPAGSVVDLTLVSDNPVDVLGEAPDPSVALVFGADVASGSGTAYDATVTTVVSSTVSVEVAAAVGVAFDATVVISTPIQRVFRGPTRTESWPITPGARLAIKVTVNQTLYRVNGLWRIGENLSYVELGNADRVYQGGYEFDLTEDQANELIDAGLGQYAVIP